MDRDLEDDPLHRRQARPARQGRCRCVTLLLGRNPDHAPSSDLPAGSMKSILPADYARMSAIGICSARRSRRISAQSSTLSTCSLPGSATARVSGKLVKIQLPRCDQNSDAADICPSRVALMNGRADRSFGHGVESWPAGRGGWKLTEGCIPTAACLLELLVTAGFASPAPGYAFDGIRRAAHPGG